MSSDIKASPLTNVLSLYTKHKKRISRGGILVLSAAYVAYLGCALAHDFNNGFVFRFWTVQ